MPLGARILSAECRLNLLASAEWLVKGSIPWLLSDYMYKEEGGEGEGERGKEDGEGEWKVDLRAGHLTNQDT